MLVTSWDEKADREEEEQNTPDYENDRQRKRSLLRKFVDVIFFDKEQEIDHSPSQTFTEIEKSTQGDPQERDTKGLMVLGFKGDQQSDDTRKQMVLGLQKLDRDRKKSLLVRVIDGLLSRSDHSQQEEIPTESIEDHAAVDIVNDEYTTGEDYWRQEGLQDIQRDDNRDSNNEVDSVDRQIQIDEEEKPTSVSAKCRQRRNGIVSITSDGQLGQPNLGFEHEGSDEIEEECTSDTSGLRRQKKSVTFCLSEFPVQPLMDGDGDGGKDLKRDSSDEKLPTITERSQEQDKETESTEDGCNPSASEDKQEVLGLPVLSPIHPAKKRRPKTIKHWLRDPNLYKVCLNRV